MNIKQMYHLPQRVGMILLSILFLYNTLALLGCTSQPSSKDEKSSDAGTNNACTGTNPPYPAITTTAPPNIKIPPNFDPKEICKYKPGQCIGSDFPSWKLIDIQPKSCGYKKSYNLMAFKGYVTVAVLLAGW